MSAPAAANATLAGYARELAAAAVPGSMPRRAYGCAAVVLATTRTITGARKALGAWDGPAAVKAAALAVLDDLIRKVA